MLDGAGHRHSRFGGRALHGALARRFQPALSTSPHVGAVRVSLSRPGGWHQTASPHGTRRPALTTLLERLEWGALEMDEGQEELLDMLPEGQEMEAAADALAADDELPAFSPTLCRGWRNFSFSQTTSHLALAPRTDRLPGFGDECSADEDLSGFMEAGVDLDEGAFEAEPAAGGRKSKSGGRGGRGDGNGRGWAQSAASAGRILHVPHTLPGGCDFGLSPMQPARKRKRVVVPQGPGLQGRAAGGAAEAHGLRTPAPPASNLSATAPAQKKAKVALSHSASPRNKKQTSQLPSNLSATAPAQKKAKVALSHSASPPNKKQTSQLRGMTGKNRKKQSKNALRVTKGAGKPLLYTRCSPMSMRASLQQLDI